MITSTRLSGLSLVLENEANLVKRLVTEDVRAVGLDNMNDYYDVRIKEERLEELTSFPNYTFVKGSFADKGLVEDLFVQYSPSIVVNLVAQAGVRYSITNPDVH